MYSTATATESLTTTPTPFTLGTQLPASNVTYGSNSVTVTDGGVYEIDYGVRGSSSVGTTITVAVGQNGTALGSATTTDTVTAGTEQRIGGSTIVNLSAGDVLTLLGSGGEATTWTPATGVNTYLVVKRLD